MKFLKVLKDVDPYQQNESIIPSYSYHLGFLHSLKDERVKAVYAANDKYEDFVRVFESIIKKLPSFESKKDHFRGTNIDLTKIINSELNNYLLMLFQCPEIHEDAIEHLTGIQRAGYEECQERNKGLFMSSAPVVVRGLNVNFTKISHDYLSSLLACKRAYDYLNEIRGDYIQDEEGSVQGDSRLINPRDEKDNIDFINNRIDILVDALNKEEEYFNSDEIDIMKKYTQELFLNDNLLDVSSLIGITKHTSLLKIQYQILDCFYLINERLIKGSRRHPKLSHFIKKLFLVFESYDVESIKKKFRNPHKLDI